jgi:hypothetical protein
MHMTSTLETRLYVGTEADATQLANAMLTALDTSTTVPREYLRMTVATTIHALDAPQRQRSGKVVKIDGEEQTRQLAALEKVIERFYPAVVKRASEDLPAGTANRAKVLNSRTNWARGAHRDVRNWIRAGHDIRTIAAVRLIKAALVVNRPRRAVTAGQVKGRVESRSKDYVAAVMELATVDKQAAITEIELLMGQLVGQLAELGVKSTKDSKEAARGGLALRVGKQVFWPTDTQVVRQQERPS